MDNGEGIVFILGATAVVFLLGIGAIGFALGKSEVASDCETFSATKIGDTFYECKEKNHVG